MLKIKDNVDLKELEKYGWIYDEDDGFLGEDVVPHYYKNFDYYNTLIVYCEMHDKRIIGTHDETISLSDEKILSYDWVNDLIVDGLVEKVEDENNNNSL